MFFRVALIMMVIAAICLSWIFLSSSQDGKLTQQEQKQIAEAVSQDVLYFPKTVIDLGEHQGSIEERFSFENRSSQTIRIEDIRTSCSCTLIQCGSGRLISIAGFNGPANNCTNGE